MTQGACALGHRQTRRNESSRKTKAKELGIVGKAELGVLDFGSGLKEVRHSLWGTDVCGAPSQAMKQEMG